MKFTNKFFVMVMLIIGIHRSSAQIPKDYEYIQLHKNYNAGDRNPIFLTSLLQKAVERKDTLYTTAISRQYLAKINLCKLFSGDGIALIRYMSSLPMISDSIQHDLSNIYNALRSRYDSKNYDKTIEKNFARLAKITGNRAVANRVSQKYIRSLKIGDLANVDNLYFVWEFTNVPQDVGFWLMYNNKNKFNRLTKKRFAEDKLKYIIYKIELEPFIDPQSESIPDWQDIKFRLLKYKEIGDEALLQAQIFYYLNKGDHNTAFPIIKVYLSKYPSAETALRQNNFAWTVFETSNDTALLKVALTWSRNAIRLEPKVGNWIDTYANILHKLGRTSEAIKYEKIALDLEPANEDIKNNLNKMMGNLRTWPGGTMVTFDQELGLNELLRKANLERKLIFIDFMATWCGPCKEMDKYVYSDDAVAEFLNKNFLSIKIQTDKTESDTDYIKNWHKDVPKLLKEYEINTFPSLVFISSDGKLVKKVVGSTDGKGLINVANEALNHHE